MEAEPLVTQESCSRTSRQILDKLDGIERRLFKDNGTLSIQTRLDRHERVLRVLLWAASVMAGTLLACNRLAPRTASPRTNHLVTVTKCPSYRQATGGSEGGA